MADREERSKLDFAFYASVRGPDGTKYMSEEDMMQCFGVQAGHRLYERMQSDAPSSSMHGVPLSTFLLLAGVANAPRSSLQEAFALFDANGDGMISMQEFRAVVQHASRLDTGLAEEHASNSSSSSTATTTPKGSGGSSGGLSRLLTPAAAESPTSPVFTERYFGADGKKQVSYAQFLNLIQEMNQAVLRYKWLSMKPDENDTVSMVSFGRLLVKELHDLPPFLSKNLLSPDNRTLRLNWEDFVAFDEVLENVDELQERLMLHLETHGQISHEAFNDIVRGVSQRRVVGACTGTSAAAAGPKAAAPPATAKSSVVMDTLFRWLDADRSNTISKREVEQLMPALQQQATAAKPPRPLALWENIVLGGSSAAVAGTVVYPMDTVKARLMNGQGTSIAGAFREIVAKQGPLALYRGLPAQLIGIMPEKALKLTLYNTLRTAMMDPATQHATYVQEALAGMGTAVVQVVITNPYELIKIRQQTVVGQPITETVRELGLRGLSKGAGACLMRDIPFNALYFSSYAALKDGLKHRQADPSAPLAPQMLMLAGLGAGLVAGSSTTPADVIKTRMQTDKSGRYKSVLDCIGQMWAEGGPKAFLKGLGPRVLLIPPMFAITMTCFETFQRYWFPQTVASPSLKHLPVGEGGPSLRSTRADVVRHQLAQLEHSLAMGDK